MSHIEKFAGERVGLEVKETTLAEAQTLGVRSGLLIARGVSEVEAHEDRIVLRMPDEPHCWDGNMVTFRSAHVDPERQIAQFRSDFPEAAHVAISWDIPDMKIGPEHEPLSALGFELEQIDVLSLTAPLERAPVPKGIDIRPVESESDWHQVIALQIDTGVEQGFERSSYEIYLRSRFASRRRQIAEGWATWLGAFEGDLLAADLGIYADHGVARFQEVETRPSHRRRGICAALVTAGVDWARSRAPDTVPVLHALSNSPAGRIYRRCGFEHCETQVLAMLPPAGTFERPDNT
ncbi:GNAT family N-acetyltransferase [Roseibium sp. SCP14]|uniref:GNAT family N-acetyltransferase n=1 Tax=Roseibium sp. SCP14 TaxID=3141375 RepID=UPI0033386B66